MRLIMSEQGIIFRVLKKGEDSRKALREVCTEYPNRKLTVFKSLREGVATPFVNPDYETKEHK